jgi:hypothetical protein
MRLRTLVPLIFVAALGGTACSDSDPVASAVPEAGPALPGRPTWLTIEPGFYTGESEPFQPLSDGDPVMIRLASQGGYVMFIGGRTDGLQPGFALAEAELINPDTGEVFVSDSRTVQFVSDEDGTGAVEPEAESASQFLHLLPCPNYELRVVHGLKWVLTVAIRALDGSSVGQATRTVVPTCAPGPRYENCVCECQPEYFFGKCGAPH